MAILRESIRGLHVGRCIDLRSRVTIVWLRYFVVLQLGAGMEGFMIKTGFYNK